MLGSNEKIGTYDAICVKHFVPSPNINAHVILVSLCKFWKGMSHPDMYLEPSRTSTKELYYENI